MEPKTITNVIAKVERDWSWDIAQFWFADGMGMSVDGRTLRLVGKASIPENTSLVGCVATFEQVDVAERQARLQAEIGPSVHVDPELQGRWLLVRLELPLETNS